MYATDQQPLIDQFRLAISISRQDPEAAARELRDALAAGLDPNATETIGSPSGRQFKQHLIAIVMKAGIGTDHAQLLEILLDAGADPKQAIRDDGTTPLMEAITGRRFDVSKLLIAHGDDVNATNSVGWSVVHAACIRGEDDLQWLEMLEAAGARMDVATIDGATPMMSLVCEPIRLRWMLERNAHRINDSDASGASVMRRAIEYASVDCVRLAIEYGADLETVNSSGSKTFDAIQWAKCVRDIQQARGTSQSFAAASEIVDFLEVVMASRSAHDAIAKVREASSSKLSPT